MADAANGVAVEQDRLGLAVRLQFATGPADDRCQPIAEHVRTAADVMAAAEQVGSLRDRVGDERHRVGVVGVIAEVGSERELHGLVAAEQAPKHLAQTRVPIADQRPQPQRQDRRVPKPPAAIVPMLGHQRDGVAHRANAREICFEPIGLVRKPPLRSRQRGI